MVSTYISTFLLAIAGIDPLGAILVASAIATGLSKVKIILFTACVFIFTIVTGVFFSYIGTNFLANITSSLPESNSSIWAYINIVIVVIICLWLYKKSKSRTVQKPKKKLIGSTLTIALAGIAFGVGAVFDPTFLAVISLAGQNGNLFTIITLHTVWILVSQIMLFGLFIAYIIGKHELILSKSKTLWHKNKQKFNMLVFGAAALSIVILAVDTLVFVTTGDYLIF